MIPAKYIPPSQQPISQSLMNENKGKKILASVFAVMLALSWAVGVACLFTSFGIFVGLLALVPVFVGLVGVLLIFLLAILYIDHLEQNVANLRQDHRPHDSANKNSTPPPCPVASLNPVSPPRLDEDSSVHCLNKDDEEPIRHADDRDLSPQPSPSDGKRASTQTLDEPPTMRKNGAAKFNKIKDQVQSRLAPLEQILSQTRALRKWITTPPILACNTINHERRSSHSPKSQNQ